MSNAGDGDNINLSDRFPDLKPINSPPSLGSVNGFGLSVYGSRDHDAETDTYITTHCITGLFLPLACIGAYRVASAPGGGWYFLGKEPLSALAKLWNVVMVAGIFSICGGIFWTGYSSSPDYVARKNIRKADTAVEVGQLTQAASLYSEVARGDTEHAATATQKLAELIDGPVQQAPIAEATTVYQVAVNLQQRSEGAAGLDDLVTSGIRLVKKHRGDSPSEALELLNVVASLAEDPQQIDVHRQPLLEAIVAAHPDDIDAASQLAAIYEQQEDFDKCKELLAPLSGKLATSEGARILGQIHANEGEFEKARALLVLYTKTRLEQLHAAEKKWESVYERARKDVFDNLNTGEATGFDYDQYDGLGEAAQVEMVESYVDKILENNDAMYNAQQAIATQSSVVPVALQLGIVQLRHAQSLEDADARKKELQDAERTFLAIQGMASESDTYNLYLGQVYYWLEKHDEGRALFDKLLTDNQRSYQMVIGVGNILREVGSYSEARSLFEEAHKTGNDADEKQGAAMIRALTSIDLDDKIEWLKRADQSDMYVRAALTMAQGNQAIERSNYDDAVKFLQDSIDINAKLTENATTLNNGALAYRAIWPLTGDRSNLDQAVKMMEKAVALQASDSILLENVYSTIMETVALDLADGQFDVSTLRHRIGVHHLGYLFSDEASEKQIVQRLKNHPQLAKAMSYADQVLVLAPKNPSTYMTANGIYSFTRDLAALEALRERLGRVQLDMAPTIERGQKYLRGELDEQMIRDGEQAIRHNEQILAAARDKDKMTQAIAISNLISGQISMARIGHPVDADRIVQLAEEAVAAVPCVSTRNNLETALSLRANKTLVAQQPTYAEMDRRASRVISPIYMLAAAIMREGELRDAVLANPDVKRVIEGRIQRCEKFPNDRGPLSWMLIKTEHPDVAIGIVEFVKGSKFSATEREVDHRLAPTSVSTALTYYWHHQMIGNEAAGRAGLEEVTKNGMPLPFDLP